MINALTPVIGLIAILKLNQGTLSESWMLLGLCGILFVVKESFIGSCTYEVDTHMGASGRPYTSAKN